MIKREGSRRDGFTRSAKGIRSAGGTRKFLGYTSGDPDKKSVMAMAMISSTVNDTLDSWAQNDT